MVHVHIIRNNTDTATIAENIDIIITIMMSDSLILESRDVKFWYIADSISVVTSISVSVRGY